jgi:hypothetical protein
MNIRKNAPTMPYSLLLVAGWVPRKNLDRIFHYYLEC